MTKALLDPTSVELRLVKAAHGEPREQLLAGVCALERAAGQEDFVGDPVAMATLAMDDPDRHLFAILALGPQLSMVGMGVLHVGGAAAVGVDNPSNAVLLRGFLIDHRHQGLGYGSKATAAAVELARELAAELQPAATGLVLGVNERNAAGLAAYRKAGFSDIGVYLGGRSGPQRVMRRQF